MKISILVGVFVLVFSSQISAQTVRNPTTLTFDSVDFDKVDRAELAITRQSDQAVVQTLVSPGPWAAMTVVVSINVQPVAFDTYVIRARVCKDALCSDWSEPSNVWDRVPGKPSKPDAK